MYVPLTRFAPDLDSYTPGVITDATDLHPTLRGYEGAPSAISAGVDALAAQCRGAFIARLLDDTLRQFAGSATKLYELSGTSWTDRTRVSGGDYTMGAEGRWSFAQLGNAIFAASPTDQLQVTTAGAFANLTGAPKAKLVAATNGFVCTGNLASDAGYPNADGVWWCADHDHTSWTPSVSTKAGQYRILEVDGPLTALHPLGQYFVAYKRTGVFLGQFVGGDILWKWTWVPGRYGTPCQDSVVNISTAHIFVGDDDIYIFDGTRPEKIGGDLRRYFFDRINQAWVTRILSQYDRAKRKVYLRYVSITNNDSGTPIPDRALIWDLQSTKWGVETRSVEACVEYAQGGGTIDSPPAPLTVSTNIDDAPDIAIDSPFWLSSVQLAAIFDSTHTPRTLSGASTSSSLTSGDFGIDDSSLLFGHIYPRYYTRPSSTQITHFYRSTSASPLTTGATRTENRGKADFKRSAPWHRLKFDFTGPVELNGAEVKGKPAGRKVGLPS